MTGPRLRTQTVTDQVSNENCGGSSVIFLFNEEIKGNILFYYEHETS